MSWPDSTMSCKYVSLSAVTSLYLNSLTGVKSPILEKSVFSAQSYVKSSLFIVEPLQVLAAYFPFLSLHCDGKWRE